MDWIERTGKSALTILNSNKKLVVNVYQRANGCPIIEPFRVWNAQIDASVAHGCAEVMMPVGSMQSIALIEVHGERHIRQIITRSSHISVTQFDVDMILAGHCWVLPCSCRNKKRVRKRISLISIYHLLGEIHIDPTFAIACHLWRDFCFWR